MNYTEAFRKYDMRLTNKLWSLSAFNAKGELGISCWTHIMSRRGDCLVACDVVIGNEAGHKETVRNLQYAFDNESPVRLIMARAKTQKGRDAIDQAESGYQLEGGKTFSVRPDLVGQVTSFDGKTFIIHFRKEQL